MHFTNYDPTPTPTYLIHQHKALVRPTTGFYQHSGMTKFWAPCFAFGCAQSIATIRTYFEMQLMYLSFEGVLNNQTDWD